MSGTCPGADYARLAPFYSGMLVDRFIGRRGLAELKKIEGEGDHAERQLEG